MKQKQKQIVLEKEKEIKRKMAEQLAEDLRKKELEAEEMNLDETQRRSSMSNESLTYSQREAIKKKKLAE